MVSSGMLRRVALVRTDVSEDLSVSFIRVTRIVELGTTLAVTSNRRTLLLLLVTASVVPSSPRLVALMKEALSPSETPVLTRATRRNIPEDTTLHSHRRENLKFYKERVEYRWAETIRKNVRRQLKHECGSTLSSYPHASRLMPVLTKSTMQMITFSYRV
jgi:hypothetical protein